MVKLFNIIENNKQTEKNEVKIKKQQVPKALKRQVWCHYIGREKGISNCMCCGITEIEKDSFDCGHVIAESKGGETNLNNLRPICGSCNSSMGTQNMDEFIEKFKLDIFLKLMKGAVNGTQNDAKGSVISTYYCKCCKYQTSVLYNYKIHLLSKTHINKSKGDTKYDKIIKTKIFKCDKCENIYMSNRSLKNHIKKC